MVLHKWKPRKVLLVGVAGGFSESGVHRGDVVIARVIYNFEYGKVTAGGFRRRQEYDFPADVNLWAFAEVVMKAAAKPWKRDIRVARPDNQEPSVSEAHEGYVASSNKVVDDPDHEFFASVRKLFPPNEIHAVEMEGSGFGISAALGYGGQSVGCLMIRGISDEPVHSGDASGGTEQRRNWKLYAADVASAFACHLIKAISSGGAPDVESVGDSSPLPELLSPDEIIGSIQTTLRGPRKSKRSGKGQLSVPTIAVHGSNMSRRCVALVHAGRRFGTGVLLPENWLLTCNHVLPSMEDAREGVAVFDCELASSKQFETPQTFSFDPEKGFYTSPEQGGDDLTLVKLKGDANAIYGRVELHDISVQIGDLVVAVSHAGGGPKQDSEPGPVVALPDGLVQYQTPTEVGSSGGPVFNKDWQIVAIHKRKGEYTDEDARTCKECYEGIRVGTVLVWAAGRAIGVPWAPSAIQPHDRIATRIMNKLEGEPGVNLEVLMPQSFQDSLLTDVEHRLTKNGRRVFHVDLRGKDLESIWELIAENCECEPAQWRASPRQAVTQRMHRLQVDALHGLGPVLMIEGYSDCIVACHSHNRSPKLFDIVKEQRWDLIKLKCCVVLFGAVRIRKLLRFLCAEKIPASNVALMSDQTLCLPSTTEDILLPGVTLYDRADWTAWLRHFNDQRPLDDDALRQVSAASGTNPAALRAGMRAFRNSGQGRAVEAARKTLGDTAEDVLSAIPKAWHGTLYDAAIGKKGEGLAFDALVEGGLLTADGRPVIEEWGRRWKEVCAHGK